MGNQISNEATGPNGKKGVASGDNVQNLFHSGMKKRGEQPNPTFPDLTAKSKAAVPEKKEKSFWKRNRSVTPPKIKPGRKSVSIPELPGSRSNSQEKKVLIYTPNRQSIQRKESDPGLDTLAVDLIRSQHKKKVTSQQISNINKTIKFVGYHQSILRELQDTIGMIGGPLLGYDLSTAQETTTLPNEDFINARMSFSSDSTDFSQKFKFKTDIYQNAMKAVKIETLQTNPKFKGDRSIALVESKTGKKRKEEIEYEKGEKFFESSKAITVRENGREREFSPEFFIPITQSQTKMMDSNSLKRLVKQTTEKNSNEQILEGESIKKLQVAMSKIEERRGSQVLDSARQQQQQQRPKTPSPIASQKISPRDSHVPARSTNAGRITISKNSSISNERKASPDFVVGKPAGMTMTKKKESSITKTENSRAKSPLNQNKNSNVSRTSKSPNVSRTSKVQNAISPEGRIQMAAQKKPMNKQAPALSVRTSESTSPVRAEGSGIGKQFPQTTRYAKKSYWKEAERANESQRITDRKERVNSNERREHDKNIKMLASNLKKETSKNPPSPLASEYVKYIQNNPNKSQSQIDPNVPVKVFDLPFRKFSAPVMVSPSANIKQPENILAVNQTGPIFYPTEKESNPPESYRGHITGFSNKMMISESRDPLETSDDDDIQPVEATLDLSEFIVNSTTNPDNEQNLFGPGEMKEKAFGRPLFQEKGANFSTNFDFDLRTRRNTEPVNDPAMSTRRNTEPMNNMKGVWEMRNQQETKKIPKIENERKFYEESQFRGEKSAGEEFDEDDFVNEIRKKMEKITGKVDHISERNRINGKGPQSYVNSNYEFDRWANQHEDVESKENSSYRMNVHNESMNSESRSKPKRIFDDVKAYEKELPIRNYNNVYQLEKKQFY